MKKLAPSILLVIVTFIAIYTGAAQIENFWSALFSPGSNEILWQIRIPRVTAALIVGASLALAGLIAQGACNNALAEPSILGTTAGASLGTVLAVLTGLVQVGSVGAIACGALGALLATSLLGPLVCSVVNGLGPHGASGLSPHPVPTLRMQSPTDCQERMVRFWNWGPARARLRVP